MLPKPDTCKPCPLYDDGQGFCPDEVVEGAEVAVIAQNPGADEEAQGRPKVGKIGQEEERFFFPRAGLTRGKVTLGNILRCRMRGPDGQKCNTMPTGETLAKAVKCCSQYLRIPPATKLIVAEGRYAWGFLGGPGSIKAWRGFLSPNYYQGKPVLGVLHVGDVVVREKKLYFPSQLDWRKIDRYLKGEWPTVVPSRMINPGEVELKLHVSEWLKPGISKYVVIDTEYHRDTKELNLVGVGVQLTNGTFNGFQLETWALTPGRKNSIRDLVTALPVVFQNGLGADIPVLEQIGLFYPDYVHIDDTMLAHACLWSELPHDLEFLATIYSPHQKMKHLKKSDPLAYNWGDVVDTGASWKALLKEFKDAPTAKYIYETQSLPLIPGLLEAHKVGLRINKPRVGPAAALYADKMVEAVRLGQAYVGWPINLGSNRQLARYLYETEGLPVQKHIKSKKPTVDTDAVAALRQKIGPAFDPDAVLSLETALERIEEGAHPVLEARVIYADALQNASHYIRPCFLFDKKGEPTGLRDRLYPAFEIHAQASGRWSSVDPSDGNQDAMKRGIPTAQLPDDLQDIIIPDPDEDWICFDWDQIELRIMACLTKDKLLLDAIQNNWDIHTLNTCDVFGWEYPPLFTKGLHTDESCQAWRESHNWKGIKDDRRTFAKRYVYRLHYRGDPKRAGDIPGAQALQLDKRALVAASNRYLGKHPGIVEWWRVNDEEVVRTRRAVTFMGRVRVLMTNDLKALKREGTNHPMQGGVRDIANETFLTIKREFPYMIFKMEAHDSQKWGCPKPFMAQTLPRVREIVQKPWIINGVTMQFPADFYIVVGGE